ncbi:MAG: hypothetical protein QNJ51_14095 [Calothrix sp. MO_167.B12]|nr:hypothetical protein [Calothrix sp. MO_167.B12]
MKLLPVACCLLPTLTQRLFQQALGMSEIKNSHWSWEQLSYKSVSSSQIDSKVEKLESMPESQVL